MALATTTEKLCQFIESFNLEDISAYAREQAIIHIIDTIGVALAATTNSATQIAMAQIGTESTGVTLWGQQLRASLVNAAWVNGVAAHALDFDDTSMISAAHLSASIVPAVMALAEHLSATGAEALEAYIVGHEIGEKVGATLPSMESYSRGWHGTAIHGVIGSTAGVAKLLRLQGSALANAFGIATSLAGGVRRNTGSMTTALHTGAAARNGIMAGLLARDGFTSDQAIFDGPLSFWDVFCWAGEAGKTVELVTPGDPLGFESPGVGIKPYPMGSPLFSVAEGMLAYKKELDFTAGEVESVKCALHPSAYHVEGVAQIKVPQDEMQAKYSVPYVVAAISVFGALGLDEFSESAIRNPDVLRIIPLVEVRELEEYKWTTDVRYETEAPTRIELKLKGHPSPYVKFVDAVKGYPQGGLYTQNEIGQKFLKCATMSLQRDHAESLLNVLFKLEAVENLDEAFVLLSAKS